MSFLASLNSGGCFAGQCDWRLPTRDELWTILSLPFPACATPPCIDLIFGPTAESFYWSSTTFAGFPFFAWVAGFHFGGVNFGSKDGGDFVRAVRGGL